MSKRLLALVGLVASLGACDSGESADDAPGASGHAGAAAASAGSGGGDLDEGGLAGGGQGGADGADAGGAGSGNAVAENAGTGESSTDGAVLPDGTNCTPAPADVEGAEADWNEFLEWQASNAEACGVSDTWPSYECASMIYDPRRMPDFTACLMADGCNTISAEDSCLLDPPSTSDDTVAGALAGLQPWLDDVCFPKSEECGFSDDHCGIVAMQVVRPEVRCAMVECIGRPCVEFDACLASFMAPFAPCSD